MFGTPMTAHSRQERFGNKCCLGKSSGFECWDRMSSSLCLQVSQPQLLALGLQLSTLGKLEGACQ